MGFIDAGGGGGGGMNAVRKSGGRLRDDGPRRDHGGRSRCM